MLPYAGKNYIANVYVHTCRHVDEV